MELSSTSYLRLFVGRRFTAPDARRGHVLTVGGDIVAEAEDIVACELYPSPTPVLTGMALVVPLGIPTDPMAPAPTPAPTPVVLLPLLVVTGVRARK